MDNGYIGEMTNTLLVVAVVAVVLVVDDDDASDYGMVVIGRRGVRPLWLCHLTLRDMKKNALIVLP